MARFQYVVLARAVPGREEAFEAWYADQHLGDVARVPGVVSARRFHIEKILAGPADAAWINLAIYEIEADDPDAVLAEIKRRAGTDEMPMSEDLVRDGMVQILAR